MVEYVAEADARYHAARAESLIQMSNALEKIETRFDRHDDWHRNVLETLLTSRRTNGIAILAVGVAALSTVATILCMVTHHG
jgi:hypothetical protein